MALAPERRLKLTALIGVLYFAGCGGAYGVEPLVAAVGPGLAILLLIITPLLYSLPMALMAAELTALIPMSGGSYVWIREGLGRYWGLQAGWCTLLGTLAALASYPVMFGLYLGYFWPGLLPEASSTGLLSAAQSRWLVSMAMIAAATWLNLRGAREVGRSSAVGTLVLLGVFAVLSALCLLKGPGLASAVGLVAHDLQGEHRGVVLLGLSVVLFNYGGWYGVGSLIGEIDRPQQNYPRALLLTLSLAAASYVIPVLAGMSVSLDPGIWRDGGGWPALAARVGGAWLGAATAIGALVSAWGMFSAEMLYATRQPFVMAADGWLPKVFSRADRKTAAPRAVIVAYGILTALMATLSFGELVILVALLELPVLVLGLIALVRLRIRRPDAVRSFRVPGGWLGLGYVVLAPLLIAALALWALMSGSEGYGRQLLLLALFIGSGTGLYGLRRGRVGGLAASATR